MSEIEYRKLTPLKNEENHFVRIPNHMIPENKKQVKIWVEEGKLVMEFV